MKKTFLTSILFLSVFSSKILSNTLDQAYFQLAQTLKESNQEQDALVYLEKAVAHNPEHAQALYQLGMHWYAQDIPQAYNYLERSCAVDFHNAHALLHAGICAMALQQFDKAIEYYQQTIALNPNDPKAHFLLGNAYTKQKNFAQAIKEFRITLELSSDSADALLCLANALRDNHELDACMEQYEKALLLDHSNQKILFEKAHALVMRADIEQAHALYQELYVQNATSPILLYNMAHLYKKMHKYDDAITLYQKILNTCPNFHQIHLACAQAYLAAGCYYQGFQELALSTKSHITEKPMLESLAQAKDKKVLITASWNNEDMIQLLRFISPLKEAGAWVILQADNQLAPLLALCPFIDQVITFDTKHIPYFDFHISMLSLPSLCVTNENTLAPYKNYITIPSAYTAQWQSKIAISKYRMRIGVYWKCQEKYYNSAEDKNISFDIVSQLAQKTYIDCYALQQPDAQELNQLSANSTLTVISKNISPETNIIQFCALMNTLDIIITHDSLVAHLAGAMNKTTLLIVPKFYEWRWVAQENQSCFYPSVYIIHNTQSDAEQLVFRIMECIGKYSRENNCGIIA